MRIFSLKGAHRRCHPKTNWAILCSHSIPWCSSPPWCAPSSPMTRMRGWILPTPPASSLTTTPPGMDLIIFVDFSGSIRKEDKKSFEQDLVKRVIPSLSAGDRLLIAPITEKTLTDFRPLIEVDFPPKPSFNGFMQNAMTYHRQVKEVDAEVSRLKEELVVQVGGMFKQYFASPRTDIFNAIVLAQKLFSDEGKAKVLVLMSDMVEDSQPYNFYRLQWGPDTVDRKSTR